MKWKFGEDGLMILSDQAGRDGTWGAGLDSLQRLKRYWTNRVGRRKVVDEKVNPISVDHLARYASLFAETMER